MSSVFLVTNGGSGDDGDEWILGSVHATEESALNAAEKSQWHREVEEWDLEGSILTDKERAAIGWAIMECDSMPTERSREAADTLRSLLERIK